MDVSPQERIWLSKLRESLVPKKGFLAKLTGRGAAPSEPESVENCLVGLRLEDYEFGKMLGIGSVGAVFEAQSSKKEHEGLPLAIKAVNLSEDNSADEHGHFERELEIGKRLNHPGIIKTLDSLKTDVARFLVMERATEGSLTDRLGQALDSANVVKALGPVAEGLQHAHEQGVIHRDLKPDNIIFGESGEGKIVDFGLSQLKDSVELTLTGQFKGTISYAAPEQFQDTKRVTPACDQFALGMILFECLSGSLPYTANPKKPMEAIMERMSQPAALLSSVRPETADSLDQVLAKMMAMQPEERFENIGEAFAAFREAVGQIS